MSVARDDFKADDEVGLTDGQFWSVRVVGKLKNFHNQAKRNWENFPESARDVQRILSKMHAHPPACKALKTLI